MSRSFLHVLLARFNVVLPGVPYPQSTWHDHRCWLFENVCLPSVAQQSVENFVWILFCDASSRARMEPWLRRFERDVPMRRVYLEQAFDVADVKKAIGSIIPGVPYLMTTRIDNDDAIGRHFMEQAQSEFNGQTCEFLNPSHGYVLACSDLRQRTHLSSPFISLVESTRSFRTVLCINHYHASRMGPVRQIGNEPLWLQTVHLYNLKNRVCGDIVPLENVQSEFPHIYKQSGSIVQYLCSTV